MKQGFICTVVLATLAFGFGRRTYSQGDGPLAFVLMPKKTFMPTALWVNGKSQTGIGDNTAKNDVSFNNNIFILALPYTFGIAKQAAQINLVSGYASAHAKSTANNLDQKNSGVIDPGLVLTAGLVNTPGMTLLEQVQYKKKFHVWGLLGFTAPLGSYDRGELINTGINKWSFRTGLLMSYSFGSNPNKQSIIELTTTITFFTNNNEPFEGEVTKQETLFVNEFHFNQYFSKAFFASIDFRMQEGGLSRTDGNSDNNLISQYAFGPSAQYASMEVLLFRASYGYQVFANSKDADGIRLGIIYIFINKKYKQVAMKAMEHAN